MDIEITEGSDPVTARSLSYGKQKPLRRDRTGKPHASQANRKDISF